MALYIRPYLIFFSSIYSVKVISIKKFYLLKFYLLFYFIFSIPGMLLMYIWEGIFKIGNNEINLMQDYHNPKFIFKNLPIFFHFFILHFTF